MAIAPNLLNRLEADCSLSGNVEIEYRVMFADPTILHLAQLFKSEILNPGLAGTLYTESLTNVLAVHLLRNYSGRALAPVVPDGALDDLKLNSLKDFIEENIAEDLTIVKMADVVHMSQFHFARAFRRTTGFTPQQYLMQQRIELAKELLAKNDLPIVEISLKTGFKNQSHFTTLFRKYTKFTPKLWRELKLA